MKIYQVDPKNYFLKSLKKRTLLIMEIMRLILIRELLLTVKE